MGSDGTLLATCAVVYCVLVATISGAAHPHAHIGQVIRDWGTFAGALTTAVGAVWAAVVASRAYRQSTDNARLVAEDRHREHASKFSVWAVYNAPELTSHGGEGWGAYVHNSSDEPMYRAFAVFKDGMKPSDTLATSDNTIDVLPPGMTEYLGGSRIVLPPGTSAVYAEAGFTDRAGARWYRDWEGRLSEQPVHHRDNREA